MTRVPSFSFLTVSFEYMFISMVKMKQKTHLILTQNPYFMIPLNTIYMLNVMS